MSVPAWAEETTGSGRPPEPWSGSGRIDSAEDVGRAVAAAVGKTAGVRRATAGMSRAVGRASDVAGNARDITAVLPVVPELAGLLPWPGGIRRGATLSVIGSTSLLFTLLAAPMAAGSWAAVVGIPHLSVTPASEYAVDLSRLALVPNPGEQWATVVAALVDGLDLVVVAPPGEVPAATARSLMARARRCGSTLLATRPWPGCDVTVRLVERRWHGLGLGRGRLRVQEVTVSATGRGRAARARQVVTTFPPPSIVDQVGLLPGQIPGLTADRDLRRGRVQPATGDQAGAVRQDLRTSAATRRERAG